MIFHVDIIRSISYEINKMGVFLVGWMEFKSGILYASLSNNKSVYFKNEIGKPCLSEIAENSELCHLLYRHNIHTNTKRDQYTRNSNIHTTRAYCDSRYRCCWDEYTRTHTHIQTARNTFITVEFIGSTHRNIYPYNGCLATICLLNIE